MSNGEGDTGQAHPGGSEDGKRFGSRMKDEMGAASDAARHGAESLREEAVHAASRMKEEAAARGEHMRDQASEGVGRFAEALREASDELSEKQPGLVADLLGQAAGGLEAFSRSFESKSSGEMIDGIRSFGRHNPMAFIAGSVLAGFAVGRLAGSSAPIKPFRQTRSEPDPDWYPTTADSRINRGATEDELRPSATENMGGGQ
ncbi:MAG: hypothetical protein ACTHJ3_01905 [Pararhizobium sp.]